VKFANKEGKTEFVWATSWGVSTRLIGGLIMTHSDDEGLVLPPKLAPIHVAIIPIYKSKEQLEAITSKVNDLQTALKAKGISVHFDDDDNRRPGWKFAQYEAKGVPVRVAIGPRDLENNNAEVARRDTKEKSIVNWDDIENHISDLLVDIQSNLFNKANKFKEDKTTEVDTYDEFKSVLKEKGGFISAHWDGTQATENKIKEETKATIRCIPLDNKEEGGQCIKTGKFSTQRVLFAKAY
jgi:prolyl-tRNA synthetase